jgi:trehalose/maltose hydrolase-like predicted phosphorylase
LREDHISGDIAFAIWQEFLMRKDEAWLRSVGYPMLKGIADFWVSRSTMVTNAEG